MKFTAQEEFGLRCLLQAARVEPGQFLNIDEVAALEGITPAYAAKLMRLLRKGGLLRSTRGQKGGYTLMKAPSEIFLSEVFEALGARLYNEQFCDRYAGVKDQCVHKAECSLRCLWSGIDRVVYSFLESCRLSDLAGSEKAMDCWVNQHITQLPSRAGAEA